MKERLRKLLKLINEEFEDLLLEDAQIIGMKIRLKIKDDTTIDIYYPIDNKYSFHWERGKETIRINTSPHHKEIKTYPRHIHYGEKVEEDYITSLNLPPEENIRRYKKIFKFLIFVTCKSF